MESGHEIGITLENLLSIISELDQKGLDLEKFAIFGSFALPIYAKISEVKQSALDRRTNDLDLILLPESNIDLDDYMFCSPGEEGTYKIRLDNFTDVFAEIFTTDTLTDISSENYKSFYDLIKEENTMPYKLNFNDKEYDIKVIAPWIWLGLKLVAYDKSKERKHMHDIIYFKGLVGDKEFENYLNKIKGKSEKIYKLYTKYILEEK